MVRLPRRQVHLDFHTSEQIPGVGAEFSRAQFQEALRAGHLDSITIFAKCHHSWSYYPTSVGMAHPTLGIDLMGEQIEACHEIGVRAPIYYTVGWSATDAERHPDWCVRTPAGDIKTTRWDFSAAPTDPRPPVSWKFLCPTGPYLDLMVAQTREICERYPVDGFFYDITNGPACFCERCRAGMKAEGDAEGDAGAVVAYNVRKWKRLMRACREAIAVRHPEATVFFNGTTKIYPDAHSSDVTSRIWEANTHQELEDLPTTWGGYDKFPIRAKFHLKMGAQILAMSGKFHTSWGEFGGYKHPDAIRYEAASMLAFGAACSFGDQLHPSGKMDAATYRNVGIGYAYVKEMEQYSEGGLPAASLGLWLSHSEAQDEGVSRMLLETQTDFDVVGPSEDLGRYEAVVLTGAPCLKEADVRRLSRYLEAGGRLLVLGRGALDATGTRFLLLVGATYAGPAACAEDYTVLRGGEDSVLRGLFVPGPFLNYSAAIRVRPEPSAEILADVVEPYFDRTYGTYCSHLNTPYKTSPAGHPAALRADRVVLLTHDLGALYHAHGARIHRELFKAALDLVHTRPMVRASLPSAGRVSLLHQKDKRRYVLHLLYAPPLQRGRCLVIEDLPALANVEVRLALPTRPRRAILAPGDRELVTEPGPRTEIRLTVPEMRGHCAIVLDY